MESKPFPLEDEFGDIIKKARSGLGLSVAEAAARAGIQEEALARMEAYEKMPRDQDVKALAGLLGLAPGKLHRIVAPDYAPPAVPEQFGPFIVQTIAAQPGEANCYVISHEQQAYSIIVDPGTTAERIETALEVRKLPLTAVLVTHRHGDHVQSLASVEAKLQKATDEPFTTWKTPGHTADSCSFLFPGFVFVGDLLFAGSVGRAQSGEDWYRIHLESGRRILSLPDDTAIFPGHGPATTVGAEKHNNPFFDIIGHDV